MKAVILAGGLGTRLRPVTYEIPKPLIPVQGRPVIEYSIENLLAFGCDKIFVVISKEHEKQFRKWLSQFSDEHNILTGAIELVLEDEPRGTFAALHKVRDELIDEDVFFVSNADELKDVDLKALFEAHNVNDGIATIPLAEVDTERAKTLGVAVLGEGGIITSYKEKPAQPQSNWVSIGGPYVISPKIFDFFDPSKQTSLIEYDLWEPLSTKGLLNGVKHLGQYFGTDTLERWEKAIREYKHRTPKY